MDGFHGTSLGHSYLADGWIGPEKRTSTGSRFGRFHPYSGTACGGGSHDSFAVRSEISTYTNTPASYGIPTSQFIPNTSIPETEMLSDTGAMLMQALMQQDLSPYGTNNVASTTDPLPILQQFSHSGSTPRTSRSFSYSAIGKQRPHPFYYRQRKETAEGMTRTRDKYRVVYTDKQRKGLEAEYKANKFITMQRKLELAKELNLSYRQIKIWFQNRRAKERRDLIKNESSSDSEKTAVKSQAISIQSTKVNKNVSSCTSDYYAENQLQPEINESGRFSTGHCRFMSSEDTTSDCAQSKFGEPHKQGVLPRLSVSPTEWNQTFNNGFSGYNSTVNVSPINMEFGFGPRL